MLCQQSSAVSLTVSTRDSLVISSNAQQPAEQAKQQPAIFPNARFSRDGNKLVRLRKKRRLMCWRFVMPGALCWQLQPKNELCDARCITFGMVMCTKREREREREDGRRSVPRPPGEHSVPHTVIRFSGSFNLGLNAAPTADRVRERPGSSLT